jgi:hypothetical protein
MVPAPVPGEAIELRQVVVADLHLLLATHEVGARPNQADPRIVVQAVIVELATLDRPAA